MSGESALAPLDLQERLARRKDERFKRLRPVNDTEDVLGSSLFKPIATWFLVITPAYRQVRYEPDRLPHDRPVTHSGPDNSISLRAQGIEQSLEVSCRKDSVNVVSHKSPSITRWMVET